MVRRVERGATQGFNEMERRMLQAYLNDTEIKSTVVAIMQAHYDADDIIHGGYWPNSTGRVVECLLQNPSNTDLLIVVCSFR